MLFGLFKCGGRSAYTLIKIKVVLQIYTFLMYFTDVSLARSLQAVLNPGVALIVRY